VREALLACAAAAGIAVCENESSADAEYPAFEAAAQEKLQGLLATDADLEKELPILFGELFAAQTGEGWEIGRRLYEAFRRYADTAKLKPGAYRRELMDALVLVQRLGQLYRQ